MTVLENVMVAPIGQRGEHLLGNWLAAAASPARGARACREGAALHRLRRPLGARGSSRRGCSPAASASFWNSPASSWPSRALILLDEPGAGVNPALLETIVERIVELNRQGMTFLVIEHNMDLVMSLCRPSW